MRGNPQPPVSYGTVARAAHWGIALLAVIAIALAWSISGAPRHSLAHEWLIVLHGSVGIVILAVMVFRAVWRLTHPPPPLPPSMARIEKLLARGTHAAFYLLFLAMPLSGYVNAAAAGRPVSLFGIVAIPPRVPESGRLSQAAMAVHLTGQLLIYALVAMHVAAALIHGLARRDGVLDRMLPARRLN